MFINKSFIVKSSLSYIFDNSLSDFIVFNSVLSLENSKKTKFHFELGADKDSSVFIND